MKTTWGGVDHRLPRAGIHTGGISSVDLGRYVPIGECTSGTSQ